MPYFSFTAYYLVLYIAFAVLGLGIQYLIIRAAIKDALRTIRKEEKQDPEELKRPKPLI